MLYFKLVASLLHDIENHCAPPNISVLLLALNRFIPTLLVSHSAGSFYIKQAKTNKQLLSSSRVGAKIWNGIPLELSSTTAVQT